MFFFDLFIAAIVTAAITLLFARGFRRAGPWASILFFILLIFLAAWAGGLWLTPFGPSLWDAPVLPFVFGGLLMALIAAAATEPPPRPSSGPSRSRSVSQVAVGVFLWALVAILALVIIIHYLLPAPTGT